MTIEESYKLATKLGYNKNYCKCHAIFLDKYGNVSYYWNGLQIPESEVGLVTIDPRSSGRYPWYKSMLNELES